MQLRSRTVPTSSVVATARHASITDVATKQPVLKPVTRGDLKRGEIPAGALKKRESSAAARSAAREVDAAVRRKNAKKSLVANNKGRQQPAAPRQCSDARRLVALSNRKPIIRGITKSELDSSYYTDEIKSWLQGQGVPTTGTKKSMIERVLTVLTKGRAVAAVKKLARRRKPFDPFRGRHRLLSAS